MSLKCAVVGLGHVGIEYCKAIREDEKTELVAVCDIFDKALGGFKSENPGIPAFRSVDELLSGAEFDAAFVLTSDPCHAEPFIRCLDSGKHVFVEKPVGNSIEDIQAMTDAIKRHPDLVTASGHILRYYPVNRTIKDMAKRGEFGEIFYMEGDYIHNLLYQGDPSRDNEALGRNWYLEDEKPMVGGGCHPFDVLRWVIDSPVVSVVSMGNNIAFPRMKHEDCIVSLYKFASGAVAKVTALYAPVSPMVPHYNISVYGTEATVWRDMVCRDHEEGFKPLQIPSYEAKHSHGFEHEIRDFVDAILNGGEVLAPALDCAQSELAVLVATEALKAGRELPIPQV